MCGVLLASTVWAPPSFIELGSIDLEVWAECHWNGRVASLLFAVCREFVFFKQHQ